MSTGYDEIVLFFTKSGSEGFGPLRGASNGASGVHRSIAGCEPNPAAKFAMLALAA